MNPALIYELKKFLHEGLREDAWGLDWTAIATTRRKNQARAKVIAKSDGVWVGEALSAAATSVATELGFNMNVQSAKPEGAKLTSGDVASKWSGDARAILALERPYLNLASYLGGIAHQTSTVVGAVQTAWKKQKGPAPRVTLTRKTLPHYRDLAIHAVIAGGGFPHRVNLAGGVLLKENHIAVAGGVAKAIAAAAAIAPHTLRIEIEVQNLRELREAAKAGAEVIMLDNFSPAQVSEALRVIAEFPRRPIIEVSGGVTSETVGAYVQPGVDILSVGSLTHSVRAIDLSLLVDLK